jgi:endonuclease YncB( thermonuclease family)
MIRVFPRIASVFCVFLLVVSLSMPSLAASDRGFANYDGDTLRATFRIANIDTPEIQGQCDTERQLALRAKEFTRVWLAKGKVTIRQTGIDRYGRVLAIVERNGEDLGEALIKAKLARPWVGKRQPWC